MALSTGVNLRLGVLVLEFGKSVAVLAVPEERSGVCEFDVQAGWTVTCFTADIDLGVCRVVGLGLRVIVFL